ncbi:MAG TPA: BMP family ABC transporter substrate-binding protein [Solirubrobacteraceae bacterium]|jgi:basic membrane lipoprotein Med (substrate-binding protein (PBP1-ABC) superfamily)|nr:BMP family ABC transporter substrate-binding protein [Solirubrobacteraceae bacterium]
MSKQWKRGGARRAGGLTAAAMLAALGVAVFGSSSPAGASTTARPASAKAPLKVAFLYENSTNDLGWDTAMYQGQQGVEAKFGSKIQVTDKVVPDGPEDTTAVKSLVAAGYKLIFLTAFNQQLYVNPAKFPGVHIVQAEYVGILDKTMPSNTSSYFTVDADGFYLAGMAAASVTKTGEVGIICGEPISDNLAESNGFALGAQAVNPSIKVRFTCTNNWDSVSVAQNAARGLMNAGAGVIAFLTTGAGPGQVAAQKGVPWIGYQTQQKAVGAKSYLAGVLWNLKPLFLKDTEQALTGTWKSHTDYVSMPEGTVSFDEGTALWKRVPAKVKAEIAAKEKLFKSGKLSPFAGPLYAQSGKLISEKGFPLDSLKVVDMNFLVKGVTGTIPKAG